MPKICSHQDCGTPIFSKGYCMYHWRQMKAQEQSLVQTDKVPAKPFKVSHIKPKSTVQAKIDRVYATMAPLFKGANPNCMAKLSDCWGRTSDIHHLYSGKNKRKYYLDTTTWITVCPNCHHKIHNVLGMEALIKLGLKKTEV